MTIRRRGRRSEIELSDCSCLYLCSCKIHCPAMPRAAHAPGNGKRLSWKTVWRQCCDAVELATIHRNAMKITVDIELDASEIGLATELLSTLRCVASTLLSNGLPWTTLSCSILRDLIVHLDLLMPVPSRNTSEA